MRGTVRQDCQRDYQPRCRRAEMDLREEWHVGTRERMLLLLAIHLHCVAVPAVQTGPCVTVRFSFLQTMSLFSRWARRDRRQAAHRVRHCLPPPPAVFQRKFIAWHSTSESSYVPSLRQEDHSNHIMREDDVRRDSNGSLEATSAATIGLHGPCRPPAALLLCGVIKETRVLTRRCVQERKRRSGLDKRKPETQRGHRTKRAALAHSEKFGRAPAPVESNLEGNLVMRKRERLAK
jgi:hypothetical protein